MSKAASIPAFDTFHKFVDYLDEPTKSRKSRTERQRFLACWDQLKRIKTLTGFKHKSQKVLKPEDVSWNSVTVQTYRSLSHMYIF